MICITKILYKLGTEGNRFHAILTPHLCSILQQDKNNANPKYSQCQVYF